MGNELLEMNAENKPDGKELATTAAASSAQHEIQSAIIIARKFPRNEEACFQKLMRAAMRPSFAQDATYSFPRGGVDVTGPSVNLAREAARLWGNIRFGLYIVRDDDETRLIRGFAYDVETNTKVEVEDDFKKLIQRKAREGPEKGRTIWVMPDERDLRELTNRRGAILLRNALLQVMPKDLIEDALYQCSKTLETEAGKDPEGERKRLLVDFMALHVTVEMLEKKLGHPFAQSSSKELAELRGICKSIQDGHTTWAEYTKEPEPQPTEDPNKAKLAAAQEALKQQQAQPKETTTQAAPVESSGEQLTMAQARTIMRDSPTIAEIGKIVNWSMRDEHLTAEERKEIMDLKDQAVGRLQKGSKKK